MDLHNYFSSSAKSAILLLLSRSNGGPIHLRGFTKILDLKTRSVQVALQALVEQGVLKESRSGRERIFSLNPRHKIYPSLRKIGDLLTEESLEKRAEREPSLDDTVQFIDDTRNFFSEESVL